MVSGYTPIGRRELLRQPLAQVEHLLERRDLERPSYTVFCGRVAGMRSLARSVLSSASVKSSVNQPVSAAPSITFVVRRPANSGWLATSVVPPISFSWRATSTPSFVETRSGSMKSAPCSAARR